MLSEELGKVRRRRETKRRRGEMVHGVVLVSVAQGRRLGGPPGRQAGGAGVGMPGTQQCVPLFEEDDRELRAGLPKR